MRWSKLKKIIESKICPSLHHRVAINSTAYGNCTCGHAWLTLDKQIIANFCTRAFWNRANRDFYQKKGRWVTDNPVPPHVSKTQNNSYGEMEYGELSRQDAYHSCWQFVHELSIDEALLSDDALIQCLAVIDSRLGKRRLKKLSTSKLHPLAKKMFAIRLDSEGISQSS